MVIMNKTFLNFAVLFAFGVLALPLNAMDTMEEGVISPGGPLILAAPASSSIDVQALLTRVEEQVQALEALGDQASHTARLARQAAQESHGVTKRLQQDVHRVQNQLDQAQQEEGRAKLAFENATQTEKITRQEKDRTGAIIDQLLQVGMDSLLPTRQALQKPMEAATIAEFINKPSFALRGPVKH